MEAVSQDSLALSTERLFSERLNDPVQERDMCRLVRENHIELIPRTKVKDKSGVVSFQRVRLVDQGRRSTDLLLGHVPVDKASVGKVVRVEPGERLLVEGLLEVWRPGRRMG